jgi:hypothetical protein
VGSEQSGGRQRRRASRKCSKGHLTVGSKEGVLVAPPTPRYRPAVACLLRSTLPGTWAANLTVRFFLRLGFLSGEELGFRANLPCLRHVGCHGREPCVPLLQLVPFPHTADASRGHQPPAFGSLLGRPPLAPGWLLHGKGAPRLFHLWSHPMLAMRFASTQLLSRCLSAWVREFCEAITTLATVAPHFAGLGDSAYLLGYLHQADFDLHDLLGSVHAFVPFSRLRGSDNEDLSPCPIKS